MSATDLLQIVLILAAAVLIAVPMGKYLALAYSLEVTWLDAVLSRSRTLCIVFAESMRESP